MEEEPTGYSNEPTSGEQFTEPATDESWWPFAIRVFLHAIINERMVVCKMPMNANSGRVEKRSDDED